MATPLGLLDLSIVTDRLIEQLKTFTSTSHLWDADPTTKFKISYTGLAPDAARTADDGDCQVSIYLFHVAADKFYRNTYRTGGSAQQVPEQPLALTLYYLLTAYSKASFIKEQQAMSIALKCLHENPIVTAKVPVDREEQFTLTIEPQTVDEIGRLWQSISSPMRLSAVYRVSVIFIEPPAPITPKVVLIQPEPRPQVIQNELRSIVTGVTVSSDGRATITIAGAGFDADEAEVHIRALPLKVTTTSPPGDGEFRVASATTLELKVPLNTPTGRYLLTVLPATGKPTIELWLDVP